MGRGELPDYPWDLMGPYRERAAAHAGGLVDLSIGSPVDPTPAVVRDALSLATDAHAYPATIGTLARSGPEKRPITTAHTPHFSKNLCPVSIRCG